MHNHLTPQILFRWILFAACQRHNPEVGDINSASGWVRRTRPMYHSRGSC